MDCVVLRCLSHDKDMEYAQYKLTRPLLTCPVKRTLTIGNFGYHFYLERESNPFNSFKKKRASHSRLIQHNRSFNQSTDYYVSDGAGSDYNRLGRTLYESREHEIVTKNHTKIIFHVFSEKTI